MLKLVLMDLVAAHRDVQTMRVGGKLDMHKMYKTFGTIKVCVRVNNLDTEMQARFASQGHQLIQLVKYTRSVTDFLVRELWTSDESVNTITVISASTELVPVCKALQALGKSVTIVSNANSEKFNKEGLTHKWLNSVHNQNLANGHVP